MKSTLIGARAFAVAALAALALTTLGMGVAHARASSVMVSVTTSPAAGPTRFENVAWYSYGTVPGNEGSAVMAGHVDNGLGVAGIFKDLDALEVGDDVYVERDGTRLHFVVEEIRTYPYESVPERDLFLRGGDAWLNLVTSVGEWVPAEKTYDTRLIVYARLVS